MNITIDDLFVKLNSKIILNGVSGQFHSGKISILTGPNGCGKSTLLKTIAGLLPAGRRRIFLDGQDISAFTPALLAGKRAIMLQHPRLPALMTVREYLSLARYSAASGRKQDIPAIDRALADTGCTDLSVRQVHTLSGGELRRVHLAFALAQEPELLLLDEPEAGVDAAGRAALPELLKNLQQQRQLTVIAVVHDMDMALHCADELFGMQDGKIIWHTETKRPDLLEILQKFTGGNFDFFTGTDGSLRALPHINRHYSVSPNGIKNM
ncbi:MAG: ABC transporter ATP-binding protein [Lentisphaeria bacterium]|nr:ABC transporter ATP-binding protein [Lentisphaeria bacterium]